MKLVPCAGHVVIKRDEAADKSKGGIILPDAAKDKPTRGKIVAIGKGQLLDNGSYGPVELREGITAVFRTYAGVEIEVDGEQFIVVSMNEVIACIEV